MLTSQHIDFLSRCHRHSISQYHKIRNKSRSQFQEYLLRYHASVEDDTKRVQSALCTRMRIVLSLGSDLSSRRLCAERHVTVMSTVTGCDVTTVQQHNTGSTSTPLRVARLCQIREASLVALRKFFKNLLMLACVDRSTRPIQHTRIQRFPQSLVATVPFDR